MNVSNSTSTDWKSLSGSVILFGGTFDPPQCGHLELARAAKRHVPNSSVVFIPAARNPLKARGPIAADEQRLEMLRLAIKSEPDFWVSDFEVQSGRSPSYTVDTVREVRSRLSPAQRLFFLAGGDSVATLPEWKDVETIFSILDGFLWAPRNGTGKEVLEAVAQKLSPRSLALLREGFMNIQVPVVASSEVRFRLGARSNVEAFVPPDVCAYIENAKLYRS